MKKIGYITAMLLMLMVSCEEILRVAREERVDIIGLSGLITPSLDEMAHLAKEMQREGFEVPLLIAMLRKRDSSILDDRAMRALRRKLRSQ